MGNYQAPKPSISRKTLLKRFLIRLVFPVTLLWDGLKFLVGRWFSQNIGNQVLPSQKVFFADNNKKDLQEVAEKFIEENNTSKKVQIRTYDGANLETIEINPKSAPLSRGYIIHFNPNGGYYQKKLSTMQEEANETHCTVIGFNYRNTGNSIGILRTKDDLVNDGIAQVQRLLDSKVDPHHIVLKGYSLGGAIATLVAKHFHEQDLTINVFSDRSFSNITNFVVGGIRRGSTIPNENLERETIRGKILGFVAKPFIKLALSLTSWEIEAGEAFRKIPAPYREYICVRSSKERRKKEAPLDDALITHYASLHQALKPERTIVKRKLEEAETLLRKAEEIAPISQACLEVSLNNIEEARQALKSRKLFSESPDNAHFIFPTQLHSRNGNINVTGQTIFRNFVERAISDSAPKAIGI